MSKVNVYLVGGAVRDRLMGNRPKDLDYSVEAESYEAMKEYILSSGGSIFLETPEFFTVRAKMPVLGAADFVLCRKDGQYKDGRHPENVQVGTIFDDLARRDFTMNAIAQNVETGEYLDPHNGQADIAAGRIVCVGNTLDRFNEDALRILRAIRFAITKGFEISKEIADVLDYIVAIENSELRQKLENVSSERIREELHKCFKFDTERTMITIFRYNLFFLLKGMWLKPTTEQ